MSIYSHLSYGFVIVLLGFPAMEASNSQSMNHTKNSQGKNDSMNKGFEAIEKFMDVAYDEILKFFGRYFSFSPNTPPKNEDADIRTLRGKIAENQKKLDEINRKEDTKNSMDDAKVIFSENIKIVHKLALKLNNTRIDRWEKLYKRQLTDVEFISNRNLVSFDDFLQDLLQIENEKPRGNDDAERMKRVANLRDEITHIWNVLKIYENQTETNSKNVKKQANRAIEKFHTLAIEMNREGMLTHYAYLQLKHRAGQERQDLKSIVFDVGKVLNEFETDPDASIIITASTALKFIKLYLITFLPIDFFDGANREEKIEKVSDLLHYSKRMISLIFRGMYRTIPDEHRLANITESVKSSKDIMSSIQDMSFYIKKIKEYYDEIYWNGANRLNEAEKKEQKEQDRRSGRTDYDTLRESHHKLINLIYSYNNSKQVEANGRKVMNEAISAIRNLGRKLHINTMGIYVDRINTAVDEGSIDAEKLSRVLGIVVSAEKQATAKIAGNPIDLYVLKLKEISSELLAPITVILYFIPELATKMGPLVAKPVLQTAWKIVDQRTVNGYNAFEEEVEDIKYSLKDHEGEPKKLEKDLMNLGATIDKFIRRNIGLM